MLPLGKSVGQSVSPGVTVCRFSSEVGDLEDQQSSAKLSDDEAGARPDFKRCVQVAGELAS